MKTLAELKRALVVGTKVELKSRFGKPIEDGAREVVGVQSNAWVFKSAKTPKSWLTIPPASLVEFDGKNIRTYGKGKRPLTAREKSIKDGFEKIRNKKQEEQDALSDGSTSFYQEVAYYREHDAEYLMGNEYQRGMKYDYASGMVLDASVKGEVELHYQLCA